MSIDLNRLNGSGYGSNSNNASTIESCIDRIRENIIDLHDDTFRVERKIAMINEVVQNDLVVEGVRYIKEARIPVIEGQSRYSLPNDNLSLTHIYFQGYFNQRLLAEGLLDFRIWDYYGYADYSIDYQNGSSGYLAYVNERSSANQFEVLPISSIDTFAKGNLSRGDLPDSASINDMWIDFDGRMYNATGDYNDETAILEVLSRGITFSAIEAGTRYIKISINRDGDSGTASLIKSGAGTYSNPYLYAFLIYDDDMSNASLEALLVGDADIIGFSAGDLDSTALLGETYLSNLGLGSWHMFELVVFYEARFDPYQNLSDTFGNITPVALNDGVAISYLASANLLEKKDSYSADKVNRMRARGLGIIGESVFRGNKQLVPRRMRGR